MLTDELRTLYALQQLDSAMMSLEREYAKLDQGKAEAAATAAARADAEQATAALKEIRGNHNDAELERKTVATKCADFETKLYSGAVSNPKELQNMQAEVEALQRQQESLDQKLNGMIDKMEALQARDEELKSIYKAGEAALKTKVTAYKRAANKLITMARALKEQRDAAAAAIAESLLTEYERLRKGKNGVAIAVLEDANACSACKMGLPFRIVESVKAGKVIPYCDNCGRILCETAEEPEPEVETPVVEKPVVEKKPVTKRGAAKAAAVELETGAEEPVVVKAPRKTTRAKVAPVDASA